MLLWDQALGAHGRSLPGWEAHISQVMALAVPVTGLEPQEAYQEGLLLRGGRYEICDLYIVGNVPGWPGSLDLTNLTEVTGPCPLTLWSTCV